MPTRRWPGSAEADAQFDGIFVLRTNMKLSALAVVLRYRNLLAVERSFLTSKALFATRPVFHRTDAAIRGHIFCTFLALVLRKELLDRLAARSTVLPEWQHIVDDLSRSQHRRGRPGWTPCAVANRPAYQHRSDLPSP